MEIYNRGGIFARMSNQAELDADWVVSKEKEAKRKNK
jgi:hypothetical protein